ncbi:MAG: SDR family NAD(P)-dependent oxidoreductase [Gammaproteobacteria bacterium]
MAKRLDGRVAVVTGSGQSIGRAIAMLMAAEGARVVVNSRREANPDDTPTARDTLAQIQAAGGTATAVFADVGTAAGCDAVIGTALDTYGRIDILVNNAGGGGVTQLIDTSDEEWNRVIGGNLNSQFWCSRRAARAMLAQGWGRIVNVGSNVGLYGMPGMSAYAAAKAGSMGFTFALAQELAGTGITVNELLPTASTLRNERSRAERERRTGHVTVASPLRTPEAIAPLAVYLCTESAANISGQVLYAAGGQITHYGWPPAARTIVKTAHWTLDELDTQFQRYFGSHFPPPKIPLPVS